MKTSLIGTMALLFWLRVSPAQTTNYFLPVTDGFVSMLGAGFINTNGALSMGRGQNAELVFQAFDATSYNSILLTLYDYTLPVDTSTFSVYGSASADGVISAADYGEGTYLGTMTFPQNLNYGDAVSFDVTAFVQSNSEPYFRFQLAGGWGDAFSSLHDYEASPSRIIATVLQNKPIAITIIPSGANVILTWPTNAGGATLEFASSLVPPIAWTTNSTVPVVIGGQDVVTNPISGTQQFFRLSFSP